MEFTNPETRANYEMLTGDRIVHKPQIYSGKLSGIPPAMAEAMVIGKSNLVRKRLVEVEKPSAIEEPMVIEPESEQTT